MQKTSLSSNDCSKATSKSEVISQLNNKKLLQLKKFVVMEKNKQTNKQKTVLAPLSVFDKSLCK